MRKAGPKKLYNQMWKRRYLSFFALNTILLLMHWLSELMVPNSGAARASVANEIIEKTKNTDVGVRASSSIGHSSASKSSQTATSTEKRTEITADMTHSGSISATVMGFATGYDSSVFKRFVGSLRKTGFEGTIILAVEPVMKEGVEEYLQAKNVTMKKVQFVNCSNPMMEESEITDVHGKEVLSCIHPYSNLKARWGRYPFLRDALRDCEKCTGPVLLSDVRDTFFQRDPFGDEAHPVEDLQVFEEDPRMRTTNWLVEWPVRECKNITFDRPMLCSGTSIGTRDAMLSYIDAMHNEMKLWMADPKCHFKINGDDQSIHNYLFYTGKLKATAIPNRQGIVVTVGAQAAAVRKEHFANTEAKGLSQREAQIFPYPGSNYSQGLWLGKQFQITDDHGYFVNMDGTQSCVVHQYDRYGFQLERWLQTRSGLIDS